MIKQNILFISYDGMTDPLGQSQVLPYVFGLRKKGYQFTLISFEKEDRYKANHEHILQLCQQNDITWIPLMYTKKPPVLSTIYDILRLNKLVKKLHKQKPFDLMHCRSYLSALIGLGFKRKHHVKFLFDMRGFWADERIDGNIWSMNSPIHKRIYTYFKRKEKEFLNESDGVISLTEAGKNEMLSWEVKENIENKVQVIPCCVDLKLFNTSNINTDLVQTKKAELQIRPEHFILGYVGSIGTWYLLDEMLEYFKELLKINPNALFLFVSAEDPNMIYNKLDPSLHSKVRIQACQHKDVPSYISLFDESIFFIKPSYSKKASSPTKQAEIMAMGIPLVCNSEVGDTEQLVRRFNSGKVVKEFSTENYRNTILEKGNFDKNLTQLGSIDYFSLDKGIELYQSSYERILP